MEPALGLGLLVTPVLPPPVSWGRVGLVGLKLAGGTRFPSRRERGGLGGGLLDPRRREPGWFLEEKHLGWPGPPASLGECRPLFIKPWLSTGWAPISLSCFVI